MGVVWGGVVHASHRTLPHLHCCPQVILPSLLVSLKSQRHQNRFFCHSFDEKVSNKVVETQRLHYLKQYPAWFGNLRTFLFVTFGIEFEKVLLDMRTLIYFVLFFVPFVCMMHS